MLRETDLPCSDCGAELVELSVDSRMLSSTSPSEGTITVADCPECGARYFPARALALLGARAGVPREPEGR